MAALEDIIDSNIDAGKKVVVFARFVPEIDAISRMLTKKSIGHAIIKGDVTDRAEQVQAFQTNPEIKVFIGQLATTGMGLTLTAGTVAVYYSLDFSYANYEQSRARIRRIGQTQRGVYIHLVARGTIDEHVMSALQHKQALCVKSRGTIIGVLLFSRSNNMICCLAVDPEHRKQGIASILLRKALNELDRSREITVSTFRENDEKGIAPRALYRKFGFQEGELTEEFGYPNQVFVLHP